jgi:type IV pilus assembly protein PilM
MKLNLTAKIDFLSAFKNKTFLGVDIGTSSIKIVQLTREKNKYKLDTYGEVHLYEKDTQGRLEETSLKMLDDQVATLLRKIIAEAGVKAKKIAMSVPVFSSFSTIIEMPDLPRGELNKAIEFQSRQYIPVPMDQISLNSIIISREKKNKNSSGKLEVLLVAVPNEVKRKYNNIAKLSGLDLVALEMETFPMARAIIEDSKKAFLIIDIGAKSTNYCIVDGGFVRLSHNFDVSGVDITKAFADYSGGDYLKGESIKRSMGLKMTPGQKDMAPEVLSSVSSIASEAERIMSAYFNKTTIRIEDIVLSGGSANMPGLSDYLSEKLNLNILIANPFKKIIYPKELEKILKEIGPSFSIAVGLAMRR